MCLVKPIQIEAFDRLLKTLHQSESGSGANTQNKKDFTMRWGMKYCTWKQCQTLWKFLFKATCTFGKCATK